MKKSILKSNGIGISRRNSIAGGNSLFSHNNMMLHGSLRVMNIRPQGSMLSQRRMVELRSYHAILKMLERLHVYQRYTPIIEFKII